MPDSQRGFKLVARLKGETENEAAHILRAAEQRLSEAEARLESVRALVQEYRGHGAFVSGAVSQLRDARGFMSQLQTALEEQLKVVERERRATEAARAQWISARMQREAMDRLVDKRRAVETKRRERSEQRQIDDRFMRPPVDAFTRTMY